MSADQSSNKRIARNTLMLYIRMLISMLVGLYTSRVVLQTLGVEDYGIFGVVGGVVSMMGFLNASMSGATSRFITFELGKGDMQRVRDTFSSAMIIHIGIALVVLLLAETVGLWFLCNKLVIPEGRMVAAHWVYQCSIISAVVSITQSPYTAVIMSREKMDIYAYMELLNVTLKLLIVYLLLIGNFDKLILYSILTLIVSVLIAALYRIYCIRKFEESHFRWVWNTELLKPMMSFSGWDLYGNMSYSVVQQGRNFIVNMFFGVAVNAACGIAATVQGVLQAFSNSIVGAIRPQIIKSYSTNDYSRVQSLIANGTKFSIILLMLFSVPIILNMDYILSLWLGDVPKFTNSFCIILILQNIVGVCSNYFIIGIHATGNIKRFFYTGTLALLQLPFLYFLFQIIINPNWLYYTSFIYGILFVIICGMILKKQIPQISMLAIYRELLMTLMISICCVLPIVYLKMMVTGIYALISCYFVYAIILLIVSFFFLLNKRLRQQIVEKIVSNGNNKLD